MDELRIREWCRGSPASIVIRFHRDITNEEIEAFPKALLAALASLGSATPADCERSGSRPWPVCVNCYKANRPGSINCWKCHGNVFRGPCDACTTYAGCELECRLAKQPPSTGGG
jgi:hypothetical protein